jgi:sporulation protein YlmC with PRC-barrel domain
MYLFAGAVAALLLLGSANAQERLAQPASRIDQSLVGLPIISSDGERVGRVTDIGLDGNEPILVGEIERPLGIGADPVAIPAEMFEREGDHIALTITAVGVRARLARPQQ